MIEYEKITKENLEEILLNTFEEFQKASYNDREKISKIVDKYILDFAKIDLLPNEKIILETDGKTKVFEKSSDFEIWNMLEETKDIKSAFDKYPNAFLSENEIKFSHFKYIDELDAILAKKYDLYINDDKLHIYPSNACYIITRSKMFFALNSSSPWAAIAKNCSGKELPDIGINGKKPSNMAPVFEDMFGQSIFWISGNKFLAIENVMSLNGLEKNKIKSEIKTGPKQEKIDELVKIPLPKIDIEIPENCHLVSDSPYTKTFIQSYGENKAVIRWLLKNKVTGCVLEGFRIYVDGKTLYPCKNNNDGRFVYTSISNFKVENFISCEMADFEEKDCEGTILSYYSSVVKSIPTEFKSLIIFEFIQTPKVEQLFKMGLEKYFYDLLNKHEYELLNVFQKDFCITDTKKEKNIYKYLGFNKYQFSIILKRLLISKEKTLNEIKLAKMLFEKVSDIDNKTTDAFFDACNKACWGHSEWDRDILMLNDEYKTEFEYFRNNSDENIKKNFVTSVLKALTYDYRTQRYFLDYLRMLCVVDEAKMSLLFDDELDLENKHDNISSLVKLKRDHYTFKAFVNNLGKVKSLEFEDDDKYCVVIPKGPSDLVEEGNALHHCVGSYVNSVANGKTNIVFIRKKDEINKSFFTVEVSNGMEVEQVHGFGNSNASSVPDLLKFVNKWAKEKGLKLDTINKVR